MTTVRFFTLLSPLIAILFGGILLSAWALWRRSYILTFALAFLAFAVGSLTQILHVPDDAGANALLSAAFYLAAAVLLVEAYLTRIGRPSGRSTTVPIAAAIFVLIAYFYYVDRNLIARIYVLNFGLGAFFCAAAIRIGNPARRPILDRFLFWEILAFGIQFFVRTAFTTTLDLQNATFGEFGVSRFWIALNFTLIFFTVAVGITLLAAIAFDVIADLRREADTDALTDIANRRGFEHAAKERLAATGSASLVIMDLDRFKRINDHYGHQAGDRVLREFAARLRAAAGPHDLVARVGGEEFVALLANADEAAARGWAEALRLAMRSSDFGLGEEVVTASFGVAEQNAGDSLSTLLEAADQRLYAAKREGRDRVVSDGLRELVAPPATDGRRHGSRATPPQTAPDPG